MIAKISVNRSALYAGWPPIQIDTPRGTFYARHLEIRGPSRLVVPPGAPHPEAKQPTVWIEAQFEDLVFSR